jgi:Microbial transglutaminase
VKEEQVQKWLLRAMIAVMVGLGPPTLVATTAQAETVASAISSHPPLAPPLAHGRSSKTWRVNDYIVAWEKYKGRAMTSDERDSLARGCIGVTVINLESEDFGSPPLNLSFGSLDTAKAVQNALNKVAEKHLNSPQYAEAVSRDPLLKRLKNVVWALPAFIDSAKVKAEIFSKRFYSRQNPDWSAQQARAVYRPDAATNQVDMSTYRYVPRWGYINYDYGWFEQDTDSWWHANHEEPGMEIYQSTLKDYSKPLPDFDEQVFSVAFAKND